MVNDFEIFANRYISPTVYTYTVMSDPRLNLESTDTDHFHSSSFSQWTIEIKPPEEVVSAETPSKPG